VFNLHRRHVHLPGDQPGQRQVAGINGTRIERILRIYTDIFYPCSSVPSVLSVCYFQPRHIHLPGDEPGQQQVAGINGTRIERILRIYTDIFYPCSSVPSVLSVCYFQPRHLHLPGDQPGQQ
jgi:hypothetical protein